MKIDLHTHSAISDGEDAPDTLVAKALAAGLKVIALTDHDTFDGLAAASAAAADTGLQVLTGIELSTQERGVSVHLLGYGARTDDGALLAELHTIRQGRTSRIPAMCAQLSAAGLRITPADVLAQAAGAPSLGRPHVADALIEKGYVANRAEAFEHWLAEGKPGYVHRYAVPLEQGIALLRAAGAVTVLAHPWGRGSHTVLTPVRIRDLVLRHGLDGFEVDHTDHDANARVALRMLGRELDAVTTGSSDFHGRGKPLNPLGINTTTPETYGEILQRIAARGGTAFLEDR